MYEFNSQSEAVNEAVLHECGLADKSLHPGQMFKTASTVYTPMGTFINAGTVFEGDDLSRGAGLQ